MSQLRVAQDTAKKQLRAYMSFDGITNERMDANGTMEIKISFRNSGQTPAYRVDGRPFHTHTSGVTFDNLPKDAQSTPDSEVTEMICGPGSKLTFPLKVRDLTNVLPSIELGHLILWVYGHFIYRDIFNKWYKLRYCLYLTGSLDGAPRHFMGAPRGNDEIALPCEPSEPERKFWN